MSLIKIYKSLLKEYISNPLIDFMRYLKSSEEDKKESLPYTFGWVFDTFCEYNDIDEEDYKESSDHPVDIDGLKNDHPELFQQFAEYLYDKITSDEYDRIGIDAAELPSWYYFDDSPTVVKNQWLIHFTKHADRIASNGFTQGVNNHEMLGLTTDIGFDKSNGGYNFAYKISDFDRYHGYKYGSEAVIFRASGVYTWHDDDDEHQVIFWGRLATNIVPIVEGENEKWGVWGRGRCLFESDELYDVANWVIDNYDQYKNVF